MFRIPNRAVRGARPSIPARRAAAAILVGLLAAACSSAGAGVDRPPGDPTPPPSPTPSAAASASPVAAARVEASQEPTTTVVTPGAGILPRSLTYGVLKWTITDAAITNQNPATFVKGSDGPPTPKTSLVVDFEIRNDDPHIFFVTTTSRLVAELTGGTIVPGVDLERPSAEPQSTVESRYAFEVPAGTTFDQVTLRLEDPDREPSFDVPLSGAAPDVEANRTAKIGQTKAIPLPGIEMRWTIDSLLTGRDWPLPIGFKGGTRVDGARAETDHQLVGIVAKVNVDRCDCKGGVLDQSGTARLIVDGSPFTASADESSKAIMQASTFSDVMLVFDIPADAKQATLQIGPLEQPEQQTTFDLSLD